MLRIIAPFWVGPCWGVRKMSSPSGPGSGSSLVISTDAGVRSGREWNVSTSPGARPAGGSGVAGIDPEGVATVKWNVPGVLAPRMWRLVLTVTTSPGANGFAGRKLPPSRSESDSSRPVWTPLREPVTTTLPTWPIGRPRNAICVCGDATRAPGTGNTAIVGVGVAAGANPPQPASDSARSAEAAAMAAPPAGPATALRHSHLPASVPGRASATRPHTPPRIRIRAPSG